MDLDKSKGTTELEPRYRNRLSNWTVLAKDSYLDVERSTHILARSFYVPFISDNHSFFIDYIVLSKKDMIKAT